MCAHVHGKSMHVCVCSVNDVYVHVWMSWIVLITHWWQNYFEFWARIQNHSHIGRSLTYVFYYYNWVFEVFVVVWRWWRVCSCVPLSLGCCVVGVRACARAPIHWRCRNSQRHCEDCKFSRFGIPSTPSKRGYEQTYHKFVRKQCSILLIFTHTHAHAHPNSLFSCSVHIV